MASAEVTFSQLLIIIVSFYLLHAQIAISLDLPLPDIRKLRSCNINKIYQLGDSLSDTGNRIIEDPSDQCSKLPYGENFLQKPTGRCSDGLVMIDYIAIAAGVPLLNPYLKATANFSHGVNFAVSGSTALSANDLAQKNISVTGTNSSLGVQLDWMSDHFALLCNSDIDCSAGSSKNNLFIVGEFGGNDYYNAFSQDKTIKEAQTMVPEVVQSIMDAVRGAISLGAARLLVPGNFPLGCFPALLTMFQSNSTTAYDENQCLVAFNNFAVFHNNYLQKEIRRLQVEYRNTTIVYGDYYNGFKWILNNAAYIGFDATSALIDCCGMGGSYNFSASKMCGESNVTVCPDPDRHICWDGFHWTQKAQNVLADWVVADILPKFDCETKSSCFSG